MKKRLGQKAWVYFIITVFFYADIVWAMPILKDQVLAPGSFSFVRIIKLL